MQTRLTNLFSTAVTHELSGAVCSTHIQQHVSRGLEGAEVLRLVQTARPVRQKKDEHVFAACEAPGIFQKISSGQGGEDLPPCVEVRHAAFELVPSQKHEAAGVRYGCSTLLLTLIFIIDEQLSPVWKISHHVNFKQVLELDYLIFYM